MSEEDRHFSFERDLNHDEANMDDFFSLFNDDDDEVSKKLKVDDDSEYLMNEQDDVVEAVTSDVRLTFGDILLQSINCITEKDIMGALQHVVEPDVVWISIWMNQVKIDGKKCREMHGIDCAARYLSNIVAASPDMVCYVKEKKLYKKPDDSSFLVMRVTVSGSMYWVVLMNNALSAGRRLFSRNGFFGRIFRSENRSDSSNSSPLSAMSGDDDKTHKSTARSDSDSPSVASGMANRLPTCEESLDKTSSVFSVPLCEDSPMSSILQQESCRKRKKAPRQQSMMHRNFLNFRKQKLLPEEVEVGMETTNFELHRPKRTGSYIVTVTVVCHINPQHRIYKVESFRHLDWRQYFR